MHRLDSLDTPLNVSMAADNAIGAGSMEVVWALRTGSREKKRSNGNRHPICSARIAAHTTVLGKLGKWTTTSLWKKL